MKEGPVPWVFLVLVAGPPVGCGGTTASQEDTWACLDTAPGSSLTWSNWAEGFFGTYCDACHAADSPNRFGAPEGVSFDTLDEVRAMEARIQARVLDAGDMPPSGGVMDEDMALFEQWWACGGSGF